MGALGFAGLWLTGSIVCTIWVLIDASDKRSTNVGWLWLLTVFLFFPIGFIAYVIVKKSK